MSQESKRPTRQELITKYCSGFEESPVKKNPTKATKASQKPRKRTVKKNPKSPLKPEPKSPVLKEWLKKGAKQSKTKETTPKKIKKKMNKLNRNDSFEEECRKNERKMKLLLKTVVKNQQHKKCMDEIREIDNRRVKTYTPVNIEEVVPEKPLDCCDMTEEEIKDAFDKNKDYLRDIMSGRIANDRHNLFKSKQRDTLTTTSLSYNVSMIAFTNDHKRYLADKLAKHFDSYGDSYYFKVLLPELCLKIFMDRHDMTYDEAYKYLDEAPIVD